MKSLCGLSDETGLRNPLKKCTKRNICPEMEADRETLRTKELVWISGCQNQSFGKVEKIIKTIG